MSESRRLKYRDINSYLCCKKQSIPEQHRRLSYIFLTFGIIANDETKLVEKKTQTKKTPSTKGLNSLEA